VIDATRIERGLGAAGLCAVLVLACNAVVQARDWQWDFRAYYYAALAARAGLDPYDSQSIQRVAGPADVLAYKYPPLALSAFAPLTHLDFHAARRVWLGLGAVALIALGWIVSRHVLGRVLDPFLWGVVLFAWEYVVRITISSGNAELYVQLAVWAAIAALLAGRAGAFAGLATLAALPKAIAASYAVVPLALGWRRLWPAPLAVVAASAAWFGLNALATPAWTRSWLRVAADTTWRASEPARAAPSLLWLVHALLGDGAATWLVVTLVSIAVAGGAWAVLGRAQAAPAAGRVLFAVTTVTLLWPRLKDYAYLAFLPPAAWLSRDLFERGGMRRWLVVGCAGLLAGGRQIWTAEPVEQPATAAAAAVAYMPWLLALVLWLGFAAHLTTRESTSARSRSTTYRGS